MEGRNPGFRVPTKQQGRAAIDDESSTPESIQELRRKLCLKAKQELVCATGWSIRIASGPGTVEIPSVQDRRSCESLRDACDHAQALRMNLIREPDAGKPHVRFDERAVETGHGSASEAPANERAGNR